MVEAGAVMNGERKIRENSTQISHKISER